ncbi:MAG TPA: hypothetical protein VFQ54_01280, partial [Thermomicrobiales bacterium]|nr:hypothetical protein [Thermomicrobiales bacterium]
MIRVRHATVDDAPRIAEIHVRTWQSAYRGQLPGVFLDGLEPAQREPGWKRTIAESPSNVVVL